MVDASWSEIYSETCLASSTDLKPLVSYGGNEAMIVSIYVSCVAPVLRAGNEAVSKFLKLLFLVAYC